MPKLSKDFRQVIQAPWCKLDGVLEVHFFYEDHVPHPILSRWELVSASIDGEPVEDLAKLMRDNEKVLHWTAESFLP